MGRCSRLPLFEDISEEILDVVARGLVRIFVPTDDLIIINTAPDVVATIHLHYSISGSSASFGFRRHLPSFLFANFFICLVVPLRNQVRCFVLDYNLASMDVDRGASFSIDVNVTVRRYLVPVNDTIGIIRSVFAVSCVFRKAYTELDSFQVQVLNTRIDRPSYLTPADSEASGRGYFRGSSVNTLRPLAWTAD